MLDRFCPGKSFFLNPFPDPRMQMPSFEIVFLVNLSNQPPWKPINNLLNQYHYDLWTLFCHFFPLIITLTGSHWHQKNGLKPSKIMIFQKRMHMHTKIRDRGVIRERVNDNYNHRDELNPMIITHDFFGIYLNLKLNLKFNYKFRIIKICFGDIIDWNNHANCCLWRGFLDPPSRCTAVVIIH